VHALIVAAINPDNTPHGYNWTYAFPMLLFIVTALVLWGLFGRPHNRVPGRPLSLGPTSRVPAADAVTAEASAADDGTEQPPAGGAGASQ
jgi:hypothetical protein